MISQVRAQDIPSGRPACEGNIRGVRVVSCTPGVDTIAFNDAKNVRTIYGGNTYRSTKSSRIERIFLTGTPVIEYTTDADEEFDGGTANAAQVLRASYKIVMTFVVSVAAQIQCAIEAGPKLTMRVRRSRISIVEMSATAAAFFRLDFGRTTAPSAGGGAFAEIINDDTKDSAFSGKVFTFPASITPAIISVAQNDVMHEFLCSCPAAANQQHLIQQEDILYDGALAKPPTFQPGGEGFAVVQQGVGAGATGQGLLELWLTEE